MAGLYGLYNTYPTRAYISGVGAEIYKCDHLMWSHAGAMLSLQGMSPMDILGPGWIMLDGVATAAGNPRPGFFEPVLAKVFENTNKLIDAEVFERLRTALSL